MASRIKQNRLVIQLARECLENKGFRIIERYQDRGTYSRTYTIAERDGSVYLIATTGREEIRADGKLNPEYNLVQNSNDQEQARRLENNKHPDKIPAFVAVALIGSRSKPFGQVGAPISTNARSKYSFDFSGSAITPLPAITSERSCTPSLPSVKRSQSR